jgi:hypothetical protein
MRTPAAVHHNGVELWRRLAAQVGVLLCLSVEDEDEDEKKRLLRNRDGPLDKAS